MRRVLVLAVAMVVVFGLAAPATAGGVGDLQSSFHAVGGGGLAIMAHNGNAPNVAAPQFGPEGRIVPFVDGQVFCSDTILGIWIAVLDQTTALLDDTGNEFVLDGDPLDTERTPNKRVTFDLFDLGLEWWYSEGVPVLGTLPVGTHTLDWTITEAGTTFEITIQFEVVDCGT